MNRRSIMFTLLLTGLCAVLMGISTGGISLSAQGDPTTTPIPAGTSNAVWTPVERDFNGVTMVLVPAGCFMMGSGTFSDNEKPAHEVCFDKPFWISKHEVTNGDYQRFVDAGGYNTQTYWSEAGWNRKNLTVPLDTCTRISSAPAQPRVCISWFEAQAYAAWWGGRLPTEAEWEYAARGPQGLIYPWGNEFVADNVVYSKNSEGKTANVGSHLGGVSWVGALDMSGNVWEWVSSLYQPYPYKVNDGRESMPDYNHERVVRGGAFLDLRNFATASSRRHDFPYFRYYDYGFRVVVGPLLASFDSDLGSD